MNTVQTVCGVFLIAAYLLPNLALGKEKVVTQKIFASAENAAGALVMACEGSDLKAVAGILGDDGMRIVSLGDPIIDHNELE